MRARVRPAFSEQELFDLYSKPWDGDSAELRRAQTDDERKWITEHGMTRTFQGMLVTLGRGIGNGKFDSIADMSCGSGDIARQLAMGSGIEPTFGDLGPGYEYHGTLTETVPQLGMFDLFICTETVEHLDDPDGDLKLIREHCHNLLLSTPVDEGENGRPPAVGHYWRWSREDVEEMLTGAGFKVQCFNMLDMTPGWWEHCRFGMWACT